MMVLAKALQPLGKRAMLFLAAAVADFYVPTSQMAEHKIQSREHNELELRLQPVPKMLKHIRTHGCPEAYVISFKLETDSSLLRGKALSALEKYGHHGVVANLLHTRHQEVVIFPGECAVRAPTVAAAAAATVGGAGVGSKGSGDLEPELCRVILERWQAWRGE